MASPSLAGRCQSAVPHLRLSFLGPFQGTLDKSPLTGFRADTARALPAYLAVDAGTPFPRSALAGLLWPDQPEQVARQNLRQILYRLRTALGDRQADPPYLHVTAKTVGFNPASDHWLDVAAFATLLDACQSHSHQGPVVVVSPSGSGKSSVVHAGLMPRLPPLSPRRWAGDGGDGSPPAFAPAAVLSTAWRRHWFCSWSPDFEQTRLRWRPKSVA